MYLHAEFAIRSKQPGDTQEYRVLSATSGRLGIADFETIFKALSVGSAPTNGKPGSDDEPLAVCGTYAVAGDIYVTVIRQERTDLKDSGGRPITAYCCACVPYSDIQYSPAGYLDLYASIPSHQEMREGRFPRAIEVEPLEGARLQGYVDLIDSVGYSYCAGIAASVLRGGVALMRGADLGHAERLEYLDAIVCLLPFGCRASMSVSTWMQSASMHSIRLGFSDQARKHETRIVWGETFVPDPELSRSAHEYYQMLLDLKQTEGGRSFSTSELLAYLLGQRQALDLDVQVAVVGALYELNQPYLVWKGVREHRGDPSQVRDLFRTGKVHHLAEQQQLKLLHFLLATSQLNSEDTRIVSEHWRDDLWPALVDAARVRLGDPGSAGVLDLLCDLALQAARLSQLLEALLDATASALPSRLGSGKQVRREMVMRLLPDWWEELGGEPGPVREALGRYPDLLYEFVFQAGRTQSRSRLGAILTQLAAGGRAMADELRIFEVACGWSNEPLPLGSIRRLAAANSGNVAAIVDMTLTHGTNDSVGHTLEGVLTWLSEGRGGLGPGGEPAWRDVLPRLRAVKRPTPQLMATIDLLLLVLDPNSSPPFLRDRVNETSGGADAYRETLLGWSLKLDNDVLSRVVGRVVAVDCGSVRCAENSLALLDGLLADTLPEGTGKRVSKHVLSVLDKYPQLLDADSFKKRWEPRLRSYGYAVQVAERRLRRAIQPSTPVTTAAQLSASLILEYGPDAEPMIVRVLYEKRTLRDLGRFEEFRAALRASLGEFSSPEEVDAVDARLERAVLEGGFGPQLRTRYTQALIDGAFTDLTRGMHNLGKVSDHLGSDDRALLAELGKAIQEIAPQRGKINLFRKGRQ